MTTKKTTKKTVDERYTEMLEAELQASTELNKELSQELEAKDATITKLQYTIDAILTKAHTDKATFYTKMKLVKAEG